MKFHVKRKRVPSLSEVHSVPIYLVHTEKGKIRLTLAVCQISAAKCLQWTTVWWCRTDSLNQSLFLELLYHQRTDVLVSAKRVRCVRLCCWALVSRWQVIGIYIYVYIFIDRYRYHCRFVCIFLFCPSRLFSSQPTTSFLFQILLHPIGGAMREWLCGTELLLG